MRNQEIAKILNEIALYLEIREVAFKPKAYEKAAEAIETMQENVADIYKAGGLKALENISSVGCGIAIKIEEYIKTGRIKDHEKFKKQIPVDIQALSAIEGIGPKMIKLFYEKLKIKNIGDLEKAAKKGKLAKLPRSGEKLQAKILKGIEFYKRSHSRFLLGVVLPLAQNIEKRIGMVRGVSNVAIAGSLRRRKETIGDLDFLAASDHPEKVMDFFISMPEVAHVFAKGPTKSMVQLENGVAADLRVVEKKSFGAALQYFTGSKNHNIELRKIAIRQRFKLNEYGLFRGKRQIAGDGEKDIYERLGLQFVPPEIRENNGEVELARKNNLPRLVEVGDMKGDLQTHSNWTDGSASIEEMAMAAQKIGYQYIALTDHTKDLAMTGGMDEKKLMKYMKEIDELNRKIFSGFDFKILKGAEVNIKKDGSLDVKDEALEKLDIVGAAIHSHFHLSKEEQTRRLIGAMENRNVDIIFHPTGRLLQQREEIELDIDAVFKAAKATGTVLEINASPLRLDLNDENIRRALATGIKFSIGSDAHAAPELSCNIYGIFQARRGWCERKDIINAFSLREMLRFLKKDKKNR